LIILYGHPKPFKDQDFCAALPPATFSPGYGKVKVVMCLNAFSIPSTAFAISTFVLSSFYENLIIGTITIRKTSKAVQ